MMRRFILIVAMCLMFISPASALSSTDVLLTCWSDNVASKAMETTIIILSPEDNTVEIIDPINRLQRGTLVKTKYFYTITIPRNTQFSKVGEVKINRFTGRFSSKWRSPESEENLSRPEYIHGICVKNPSDKIF